MPSIVLINPEIPPNTGNIARTCAATETPLHLVMPLGFELSDRYLKRAGLDYWPYVDLHLHESIEEFWQHAHAKGGTLIGYSARAKAVYTQLRHKSDDWLIFGCEKQGAIGRSASAVRCYHHHSDERSRSRTQPQPVCLCSSRPLRGNQTDRSP